MADRIRKVVFPVAGQGTRFLPATKAVPKEMLPVVDKPLIQYAAREAVEAGAKTLIFVTGHNREVIAGHFNPSEELEAELEAGGKHDLLARAQDLLPEDVECVFVRQPRPLGLGHAILCAREAVGDEAFGVILPDDLIHADPPGTLARMADVHERTGAGLVAVQEVPGDQTGRYGIVSAGAADGRTAPIQGIVEKPAPQAAPSNLAVVGRYILPASIMDILADTTPGAGGEIQVTDAIETLLGRSEVLAYRFPGVRYDCGNKQGYVQATVRFALDDPELTEEFGAFLKSITASKIP